MIISNLSCAVKSDGISKGIDFDIESAKSIIEEEKEEYEIPLIITQPDKTVNDIGTEELRSS